MNFFSRGSLSSLIKCVLVALAMMYCALAGAVTNTWGSSAALATARWGHTSTLLTSGKVLVAGGNGGNGALSNAELYDPSSNSWAPAGLLAIARYYQTATLLPSGKVLIVGGYGNSGALSSAELYDPTSNTWTLVGSLAASRYQHTATLLPSGLVLVVAGTGSSGAVASAERYDPISNTWSPAGSLASARADATATLLPSGQVLLAGGLYNSTCVANAELYDPVNNAWTPAGSLAVARTSHIAILLPSGKVLVAAGYGNDGNNVASAELFDPATNTWILAGSLATARYNHTATLLPSGQVLVAGGYDNIEHPLASVERYDPGSNTWTFGGSLATARGTYTATLLASGQVMVVGGYGNSGVLASTERYEAAAVTWSAAGELHDSRSHHTATLLPSGQVLVAGAWPGSLANAERYDPSSNIWRAAGALATARYSHTATLLTSGKVLVAGGYINTNNTALSSAELYDPVSNSWSAAGAMAATHAEHTATLLSSGQVLLVGASYAAELYNPVSNSWSAAGAGIAWRWGHTATLLLSGKVLVAGGRANGVIVSSAQLYDPASNSWSSAGGLSAARRSHTATLLPSGKVLVAGGVNSTTGILSSAELYDPVSNSWSAAGTLGTTRYLHTAALLPSGEVLVTGGADDSLNSLSSTELYDPATNTWSAANPLGAGRYHHSATLLPTGKVLVAGGVGAAFTAELADLGLSPDLLRRPVLAKVSRFLLASSQLKANSPGSSTNANGAMLTTGFLPRLEGSGGGVNGSATNAPVIQIQRIDNDQMRFIPNDSSIKLTDTTFTGSATALAGFPAGLVLVRAWVNGVPSAALTTTMLALAPALVAPEAPTSLFATGGVGQASVAFTAPFFDGGAPVTLFTATRSPGGATATCTAPCSNISFNPLAAGSYTFTIVATNTIGDSPPSAPSNVAFVQASSATTVASSLNPSTFGASVTFTATVTGQSPSGTVTFKDGATTLCNAVALSGAGTTTCSTGTLSLGTHSIAAYYSGDANNTASSADPLSQKVGPTLTAIVTGSGVVSAAATPVPFSGNILACGSSGGSNCIASYEQNDIVTLITTPGPGQHATFAGNCSSNGTVTMDANHTCNAAFAPNVHAISGSVAGLVGSGLMLHLNYGTGSQDLSPAVGDSAFAFAPDVPYGASYLVSVSAQPSNLSQTCSLGNASGTMPDSDVTNLSVTCLTNLYTIGGTVMGLTGAGLVLQLNGGNSLPISADGGLTFSPPLPSGTSYLITFSGQPANQFCTLANASGTVTNANITDVTVHCVDTQVPLTLTIDDGRAYAQYGQTINYLVTLSNGGNTTANNIQLNSVLSAGLDSPFAQWQCLGAGSGATCTSSGTGALADTVTLPAGRSLNWIVSVPVRTAISEGTATMGVSATGAVSDSDIDTLVILRDGFDAPSGGGSGILVSASTSAAILSGEVNFPFLLPPPHGERIDIVIALRSVDIEIAIEQVALDEHQYIRVIQHEQGDKKRIGDWMPVPNDAALSITSIRTPDHQRILLLEGAAHSIDWSLTH